MWMYSSREMILAVTKLGDGGKENLTVMVNGGKKISPEGLSLHLENIAEPNAADKAK